MDDWPVRARHFPKRTALAEAQNWRCCYCGTCVDDDLPEQHPERATIDHVEPLAHSGPRRWSNEAIACYLCNTGRGRMNAFVYFELVQTSGRGKAQRIGWAWQAGEDIASAPAETINEVLRRAHHAHAFIRAPQFGVFGRGPQI